VVVAGEGRGEGASKASRGGREKNKIPQTFFINQFKRENQMLKKLLLTLAIFFTPTTQAASQLTLDFNNINLQDAIRIMAKFIGKNIILSPTITGQVTLHLSHANPSSAFAMLLTSQGLATWRTGNILLIAPRAELIARKQEELKWLDMKEATLPLITETWRIRFAKAQELASMLVSKRGHVRVDARTNVICVEDTEERMPIIRRLIHQLDVPVQQIAIEARLASVDNDFERELGVDFSVRAETSGNNPGEASEKTLARQLGRYSIAVAKLADGSRLDIKLAALENAGHAELISSPSLFTSDQQPASIEAGEEVPYQETSKGGGTAVTFKKAVLSLKVTPQVLPGNQVLLQLQINQDRPSHQMVLGMPMIQTRQITTNVLVKNGKTIVLGGIYETNREEGQHRLPFLSQVPVLGWLLKEQNTQVNKRELLIFVTPRVVTKAYE
jgi:type IV pilus assembly protein PilQ